MTEERLRASALEKLTKHLQSYSDLKYEVLRKMVDHIPVQFFSKGAELITQGQVPTKCFFVLEGCARQYALDEEGREVTSDFFTENQSIAVFTEKESPYTINCLEDSVMIVGELSEQVDEMEKYPEFQAIIGKMMEESMGILRQEFAAYVGLSPEERVRRMMELRPELFSRVPQHQLASYLGITPESLSRIKGRLGQRHLKAVD